MAGVGNYLIPGERAVVRTRRHWASLVKVGLLCAVGFLLGLVVLGDGGDSRVGSFIGVVLLLGALGWFGWRYVEWRLDELIITDRRVLLVYGLLTKKVGIMPLSKVTDLTYERSLGGRLFGFGAFVIESAGQHQAFSRIDYLPSPDRLYHDVSQLLFPAARRNADHVGDHPTRPLPPGPGPGRSLDR